MQSQQIWWEGSKVITLQRNQLSHRSCILFKTASFVPYDGARLDSSHRQIQEAQAIKRNLVSFELPIIKSEKQFQEELNIWASLASLAERHQPYRPVSSSTPMALRAFQLRHYCLTIRAEPNVLETWIQVVYLSQTCYAMKCITEVVLDYVIKIRSRERRVSKKIFKLK